MRMTEKLFVAAGICLPLLANGAAWNAQHGAAPISEIVPVAPSSQAGASRSAEDGVASSLGVLTPTPSNRLAEPAPLLIDETGRGTRLWSLVHGSLSGPGRPGR